MNNPSIQTAVCTTVATGCDCTGTGSGTVAVDSGTFSTSGPTLTTMPASGGTKMTSYCVSGTTLWIQDNSKSPPQYWAFTQ